MPNKTTCPQCGQPKKPWFELCWTCGERERQKPTCEVCGVKVEDWQTLCDQHWLEKKRGEKSTPKAKTTKKKNQTDYQEKYQGKFYFNSQRIKSKSELLICYFLTANQIQFQYETPLFINDKRYRPDFVLDDGKGHLVILEHFGGDSEAYLKRKRTKIKEYTALCKQSPEFHFVWTDEADIYNLKERLGDKLNQTPIKKPLWK
jgi:predicted nuclease of restriction endonuclease-like RecB superfamily